MLNSRLFISEVVGLVGLSLIALGGPFVVHGAPTPSQVPLLLDAPTQVPPSIAQALPPQHLMQRWVKRHRRMGLNPVGLDVLTQPRTTGAQDLTVELFDGKTHTFDLEPPRHHRTPTTVWRGRLRGEAGSEVSLALRDRTLVGTILSNDRLYKVESESGNLLRLVEIDPEALPNDHHPIVVEDDLSSAAPATGDTSTASDPTAAATAGTVVDLLVVYTTAARTQEGGQAAIEALITLGVDQANQAYTNSQIDMQLQLIHTAEVAYTDSGTIDTDLTRLRSTTTASWTRYTSSANAIRLTLWP